MLVYPGPEHPWAGAGIPADTCMQKRLFLLGTALLLPAPVLDLSKRMGCAGYMGCVGYTAALSPLCHVV